MKKDQSLKLKKNSLSNKRGFSIVELLIVVLILVVMTGVIFSNRRKGNASSEVEAVARQVAAQIRLIQNEALSGKRFDSDADTLVDANACSYIFTASGTAYSTQYKDCADVKSSAVQTVNLVTNKKKVTFDPDLTDTVVPVVSITFKSPSGKIEPAEKKAIVLSSTVDSSMKSWICVSADGVVTEQKIACP